MNVELVPRGSDLGVTIRLGDLTGPSETAFWRFVVSGGFVDVAACAERLASGETAVYVDFSVSDAATG
jgi:hypothetical protein